MKRQWHIELIIATVFTLLWAYSIASKLVDFDSYKAEMYSQVFSKGAATVVIFALPAVEVIAVYLLLKSNTRLAGFVLSFILMLSFSVYVGLALLSMYKTTPCSCSGLFKMTWREHLIFNLIFLAIATTGVLFTYKSRRVVTNRRFD